MRESEQNLYDNLIRQIDRYKHYCHEGSYKTRERYYNTCKPFCEFLAKESRTQKFVNISGKHIHAYAEHMKSYKASATIRTELSAIRKVYEWLCGKNKLPGNEKLDLPERLVGVFDKSWTPEEYRTAMALGKSMGRYDVYYGLKISFVYGARIEEACAMRVYQIKEAIRNEGLEINGKGGQVRVVPIRTAEQKQTLAELNGMFSNRTEWHPRPLIEVTEENCNAFRIWLEKEWAELPDALPTKTAASLIECQPQRIYELTKENVLHGIKIGAVQYIPKTEFISYVASPEKLSKPTSDEYRELVQEFKQKQYLERENRNRRQNRNQKGT